MADVVSKVQRDQLVRLLLVIDAEAGSEHADREAERLGLTIQLAVARERRAVRGGAWSNRRSTITWPTAARLQTAETLAKGSIAHAWEPRMRGVDLGLRLGDEVERPRGDWTSNSSDDHY